MLTLVKNIEGNLQVNFTEINSSTCTPSPQDLFSEEKKPWVRVYRNYCSIQHLTIIIGRLQVMEKMLRKYLNETNLRSRVDELTGKIIFHGNHRGRIVKWLKEMGF